MIAPVKTAIVGCGVISDAYLSTMRKRFKILDVVGCCDINPHRAQERARAHGIRALTMDDIRADDTLELVVNLTTPTAHYPVTRQLLEMGKHVYTEKVLSVELAQAADLVALARTNGLYLGAAPDTFLGAAIQTARYVVDSGMIGEVSSCVAALSRDSELFSRAYPFTAKPGGGIGFDVGIYYITALLSILGPVERVSGVIRTRHPIKPQYGLDQFGETFSIQCENLMAGMLQFKRGAIGTVLFDANSIYTFPERPSLVLFGSLGTLQMADPNLFGGEVSVILKGQHEPFVMPQTHVFGEECRGLGVAEMAWSLRRNRPHRAAMEMAYHALDVLHGLVRSSETGVDQALQSTFENRPPLPRGFSGQGVFDSIEEASIAI